MVEEGRSPPSFKILKIIGKGTFGKVFLAVNLSTGENVAIKRSPKWKRKMSREIEHLESCKKCPYIMRMHDAFYTTTPRGFYVQNIVCEYMECSLGHFIRKAKEARENDPYHRIPSHVVKTIARQILLGISFLHSKNIAHRDLKPDNILIGNVDSDLKVKISDMGSAKTLGPDTQSMSYICSRWYRAPELLFGFSEYSVAVDLWSFGCILVELYTLQPIFNGKKPKCGDNQNKRQMQPKCGSDEPYQIICIIEVLGTPSRETMETFVDRAPENVKRAGIEKLSQLYVEPLSLSALLKPFVPESDKCVVSLIEELLQWNPASRVSADKALQHEYFNIDAPGVVYNLK